MLADQVSKHSTWWHRVINQAQVAHAHHSWNDTPPLVIAAKATDKSLPAWERVAAYAILHQVTVYEAAEEILDE